MKKLTIVLAVLMLFLQVFSGTVAYGDSSDEKGIYIKTYESDQGIPYKRVMPYP